MCGLAGLWCPDRKGGLDPERAARAMAQALVHRGPDSGGFWGDPEVGLALAHRRLSIIELSPAGHQPMASPGGRYHLVFNGEIYNHLVLRRELDRVGALFNWRGHSDTEILLAAFATWGVETTIRKAVGMFALALWDRDERLLYLARDRIGEKPLYYGWVNGAFAFASELSALKQIPQFDNDIDRDVLALYTQFSAVPAPYSIYRDIFKLPPATILTLRSEHVSERRLPAPSPYWSAEEAARAGLSSRISDEAEAVSELEQSLRTAVKGQLMGDVPVGAFLSGGVDSSTIAALMQCQSSRPVKTFTIGFEDSGYDESPFARSVAQHLGTEHHEAIITSSDALSIVPRIGGYYDEPFADSSALPTLFLCQAARRHVTVALSGDGADELFGGYNRYSSGYSAWRRLSWLPMPVRRAIAFGLLAAPQRGWRLLGGALSRGTRMADLVQKFAEKLRTVRGVDDFYRGVVTEWASASRLVPNSQALPSRLDDRNIASGISSPQEQMMLLDSLTYLPDDILTKVDRAAMRYSLETRVPFLDHRVVELSWRLPLHMKIRRNESKWALRQVLYKYVPRALIERPKSGFAVPVGAWLRGSLREWAEGLLNDRHLASSGFFDPAVLASTWRDHVTGRRDSTARLWTALSFLAWFHASRERLATSHNHEPVA